MVDDLCFRDSVKGLISSHEVTDAFAEVADLNLVVLEKTISQPYPDDHGCFWLYPG